jgi:TonB family protein
MGCGIALAQQASNGSSATLAYEDGRIENNVYTNDCFGFSLAIPDGWQVNTQFLGADGKAMHIRKGGLFLLLMDQHQSGSGGNRIGLYAREAGAASASTVQEFVSAAVHGQIDIDRGRRELVRDAYSVDYGGKHFVRADYKQSLPNGDEFYLAFVYTKFREYYIGENLMAGSPRELDQSANSLEQISFLKDEPNPKCVMRGDDNPNSGGIIGGILSSKPPQTDPAQTQRVRVSSGVSTGLLVKKVPPQYPDEAKQARIQGQVVLQAKIDKNGDVEELTLVSGHPMLAPAAIEAVKQWKYKPYLLNGQPVKVETQIVVIFQLSGH